MPTEPVAANQPANPPDPAAAPPGAPAAAAPAPAQPAQQGKNVILPSRAFTERLKKAEEKGRTAYQAELDKQAQERGFANHAAMLQHLDAQRTTRTAPRPAAPAAPAAGDPPAPPKNRNDRQAMAKYEQDKAKWKREQDRKDAEIREQKRLRRKAENRANAIEVKATLERIAHSTLEFGFPCMTAGLVIGSVLVQSTPLGASYFLDPKVIASFAMWAVYVTLLFVRRSAGLRGRRAAILSGAVFLIMLVVLAANVISRIHRYGPQ